MKKSMAKIAAKTVALSVGSGPAKRAARLVLRKPTKVRSRVASTLPSNDDSHELSGPEAESGLDLEAEAEEVQEAEAVANANEGSDADVAEPAAAEEAAPARRDDERSNFLSMYFRDMARLAVLRPQEEFESARHLEQLEIAVWARVLSFQPVLDVVLQIVERFVNVNPDKPVAELKTLRRMKPSDKMDRVVLKAAEKIRALDQDKEYLDAVLAELKKIYRGLPGRLIEEKLEFSPQSKKFREYLEAVAAAYNQAHASKNSFVKANLRLVVSIARRFNYGRMPLADLIQEGNIGLIKAVERYDYHRGYRFSTYASWWIRHAISRALADKGRAVRLPVHMIDAYHRVAKSKRELSSRLGRPPNTDEIAVATGIPAPKIEKMRTFLLDQSLSLDRPVSDEDGRLFIDFIQDPNAEDHTTADTLIDEAMNNEVRSQLDQLRPIEADILRQRFGLDTDQELTLKEIGEKYNLSRERIRQLQEQALLKMRRALQRKDLM